MKKFDALIIHFLLLVVSAAAEVKAAPAPPSNLRAMAVSSSRINLAWTDNSANETGFNIQRSIDGINFSLFAQVGPNVTTYNNTGLNASTKYQYRVRSYNGSNRSAFSNIASATTFAPRIIWGHCKLTNITDSAGITRELQDMWADGGRCPRIDNNWTTAIDAAHAAGFTQMILISGGTMRSVPDTTTYANSTVALARAHPDAMIELGNECNLNGFSPQQYATMAKAAYKAVKDAGLKNIVLLGSVGNNPSRVGNYSMVDWCKQIKSYGCVQGQAFDWANYHIYGDPAVDERYVHLWTPNSAGDSCQSVFGNPPFAITEFGEACSWIGGDEAKQAAYIAQWIQAFKGQLQCKMAIQFALADNFAGNGSGFGLRRLDLSRRPSWNAYKAQVGSL
jgi:Fibronectin type III domain